MSTRGIRAGRAFVEVFADDKKLTRDLRRISTKLKTFGASVTAIGLKTMAVFAGLATPMGLAIKAASDMEEVMNKFDVVFGKNAASVKTWSDQFAISIGRSKKQVAEFLAETQDLLKPIGFNPIKAIGLSKSITQLAIDLASFNNMSDADVLRDLKAALTGSGEVMKKYGVIVSEAAVKQELMNQSLNPKNATDMQKVMARLSIIMRGTKDAQGDAVRSGNSFANMFKKMRASIDDATASLGKALLPTITKLVSKVASMASYVGNWIEQNQGVILSVAKIVAGVGVAGVSILVLGTGIKILGFAVGGLAMAASLAIGALKLIAIAAVAIVSPIGLVLAAVAAMGAYLVYATGVGGDALKWLGEKFDFLADDARDAYKGISEALKSGDIGKAAKILWLTLKLEWTRGTAALKEIWGGLWYSIDRSMENAIHRVTKRMIDAMFTFDKMKAGTKSFFKDVATMGKMLVDEIAIKNDASLSPEEREAALIENRASYHDDFESSEKEKNAAMAAANASHVKALELADEVHLGNKKKQDSKFIKDMTAIENDLANAKLDFKNAVKPKPKGERPTDGPPTLNAPPDLLDGLKNAMGGLNALKQSFAVKGGFQTSQAQLGVGSGSTLSQIASSTSRTARAAEETAENTKNMAPTYG